MEGFLQWKSFCNGRILHCKHSKIENYTTRWDSYFTLKMDRKRKAVFLRLFENSRKRRKAADEEIDRMIESLEDSADDEYQEEDEENMIGAISYASILASSSNRGGPRKKPVNRVQQKEMWSNGYVNWDDETNLTSRFDLTSRLTVVTGTDLLNHVLLNV